MKSSSNRADQRKCLSAAISHNHCMEPACSEVVWPQILLVGGAPHLCALTIGFPEEAYLLASMGSQILDKTDLQQDRCYQGSSHVPTCSCSTICSRAGRTIHGIIFSHFSIPMLFPTIPSFHSHQPRASANRGLYFLQRGGLVKRADATPHPQMHFYGRHTSSEQACVLFPFLSCWLQTDLLTQGRMCWLYPASFPH